MDYDTEKSPSSKAKCRGCNQNIPQGEMRLSATFRGYQHNQKYYYCKNCGIKVLQDEGKRTEDKIKRLTNSLWVGIEEVKGENSDG